METDGTGDLKPDLHRIPQIDSARCTGCGRCVAVCPEKIITLDVSGFRKHAEIRFFERCTLCGCCVTSCPVAAIETS